VFVETFLRVARERDRWRPTGSVRGWLFTMAHRQCLDILRRRKRDAARELQVIALETARRQTDEGEGEALEAAIGRLGQEHREVILLRLVHGLSSAEAAAILGLDEEQVRSRLSYARKRVREMLEAEDIRPGVRRRSG
jgi:RNA polymerase sigma-70 factor, ECF subfamily